MTPPALVGAGLAVLALGALVLRSYGPGYRIGRLLSAAPQVTLEEALAMAREDRPRYVRIAGRLDSSDEFEDELHRPLVFRRVRLQAHRGGRWLTIDEQRQAVDFSVRDGLVAIGVDRDALDEGLVVIPRESSGVAGEVPERLPVELPRETLVRLRVDQVSSVEHALVAGIPGRGADGSPVMTAGLGRPLILSTLEHDEAMRVLGGGSRARALAAGAALLGGSLLVLAGLGWALTSVVA